MDSSTEQPAEKIPLPKRILGLFTDWITTADPGICICLILLVAGIGLLLVTFVVGSLDQVLLQKANPAAFEDHPQVNQADAPHGPASFAFGQQAPPHQAISTDSGQTLYQPSQLSSYGDVPAAFGQPRQPATAYPAMFGQPRYQVNDQSALWKPFRSAAAQASTQ